LIFALFFFFASVPTYRFWVDPCLDTSKGCETTDPDLAAWAFEAWQQASGGLLQLTRVYDAGQADIRLHWVGARDGVYGEVRGSEVYVRPAPREEDRLLRETVTYLTCLHEAGHALGLAHTANFEDIMYSFQFGGDIPEYFGRYRRKLAKREDIRKNPGMSDTDRKRWVVLCSHR
jgi:hypothetical protein